MLKQLRMMGAGRVLMEVNVKRGAKKNVSMQGGAQTHVQIRCNVGVWFGAQKGAAMVARKNALLVDALDVREGQELETLVTQSHASHRRRRHDVDSQCCGGGTYPGGRPCGKLRGVPAF